MLDRGVHKPLTVVSAGPGYGKTLAVSAWIKRGTLPGPVAWLTADHSYDVRGLWTDLLGALRTADVLPATNPLMEILPGPKFGDPELDRIIDALASLPGPVVLVVDDFHNITDGVALGTIERLVGSHIPQLRLVLIGRTEPALHLSRLRLAGDVTEIGTHQLVYTTAEARDVCALGGFPLAAEELTRLWRRTQGWPAGLRLALMSVADSEVPTVDHFTGNNRRVAEYLLEEILDRLSPRDRLFLLATSVVDQMTADLARALSGRTDSGALLEDLVERNALTLKLSDRPGWYRYHPLLRELLQDRLAAEDPDSVPELHRLAADWYARVNEPIVALRHYSCAHRWATVAKLLGEVALPQILTSQATALVSALSTVYEENARQATIDTLVVAVVCDYQRHDFEALRRRADDADKLLPDEPEVPLVYRVIIALARMVHARAGAPGNLVEASTALLNLVESVSQQTVPAAAAYTLIALNNRAAGLVLEDRIVEAQIELTAVRAQGAHAGMSLLELSATSYLTLIDALYGNLAQAAADACGALDLAETKGWSREPQLLAAYAAKALVCLDRHDLDDAQECIDAGLMASTQGSDVGCRLLLSIAAVGVANARGDGAAAHAMLSRLDVLTHMAQPLPVLLAGWIRTARADVLLAQGDPRGALSMATETQGDAGFAAGLQRIVRAKAHLALSDPAAALDTLRPPGRFTGYRALAAEAAVLEAVARGRLRQDSLAAERMQNAVELAEPIGLRRPFYFEDGQIAVQLNRFRHLNDDRSPFVAELVQTMGATDTESAPHTAVVQALTDREMAVLKYLPTMLKSSEIAADLFVSVNTVKTHQRSIYRKLGVSNRREAVESARYWAML
ncbi:LuxR C-terminal-related transcriptional regulator [Williamsia limnetica]|nr:LuxR C-terminal-related transcriptional regulator [Williamsia limnetica]